ALKCFKDVRGLAWGMMAGGLGGGTALFIPLISSLLASRGYRDTFVATGVVQGLVILLVAQFLRHPPREPASEAAGRAPAGRGAQLHTLEMVRTTRFYLQYAVFVLLANGRVMGYGVGGRG